MARDDIIFGPSCSQRNEETMHLLVVERASPVLVFSYYLLPKDVPTIENKILATSQSIS
jgi:hypothetical protein